MAKWYGKIGYSETKETAPGVWTPARTERRIMATSSGCQEGLLLEIPSMTSCRFRIRYA